jgi:hypothetical protein
LSTGKELANSVTVNKTSSYKTVKETLI